MKFLIVQLPPFSRHLIPFRSKYSSQNPVLKHPVYALPLAPETKFHTHTKQLVELWFFYILTFTFLDSRRDDKRL
jgi:hypothetical protein